MSTPLRRRRVAKLCRNVGALMRLAGPVFCTAEKNSMIQSLPPKAVALPALSVQ